ncbi:MAG TPA: NAD(P)H-hydrate dehydratase [Anaerolineales bacterium]|nr:NAD(P)H-hydrate dehydratase [Anaerolineales bacterium]
MKLVTVAEMQQIERESDASGLTYEKMMEHAGLGLANVVHEVYLELKQQGALGLVGSGNNGGDTLVALAHLAEWGWKTSAYVIRERPGDDPLLARLRGAGGEIYSVAKDTKFEKLAQLIAEHGVLLDGVLGTGIHLPLRGKLAEAIDKVRQLVEALENSPAVVAVDCPSGVDTASGEAAPECIPADLTVTMAAVKTGLLQFPAAKLVGDLRVVGIGLEGDETVSEAWQGVKRQVADVAMVRGILPPRPLDSHKGTFGTVLAVVGSVNYTGAALMSGKAAYRSGAGLVTLAVPAPLHAALAGHFPEATWLLLPHEMGVISEGAVEVIRENLERPTAMLIGCGFGLEDVTKDFLSDLIGDSSRPGRGGIGFIIGSQKEVRSKKADLPPLVIDADGLKLLARIPGWQTLIPAPAVLTPHPGEMSVLTGLAVKEIQSERIGTAEKFAKEWGHIVVLKGAHTVVASPDGSTTVIPVASPALARAGTGDVLAGLIAGLRAQGVDAYPAAVAGCWIHAQAGLRTADLLGSTAAVLAGDILEGVQIVMAELSED